MRSSTASKDDNWTIIRLLEWATAFFDSHGIESPRAAGEILLARVLNLQRVDLYLRYDQPLLKSELESFKVLLRRRLQREPVAYILGRREFWSLDLSISRDVLIPRPETECLVEQALADLAAHGPPAACRIIDLGTGSGAIILALASRHPRCTCFASDISLRAIRLAGRNARTHGLGDRIHFFCGDWTKPLRSSGLHFDMIVANPPYIASGQIRDLQPEIYRYEPLLALDGGDDGLRCLGQIVAEAHHVLKPGGSLLLEIGYDQREAVQRLLKNSGHYDEPFFYKDYSGFDRVAKTRKMI